MKLGYSMLLSEHIGAERLGYEDCKSFQVVCPACREPIFKVTREHPVVLHYLSHYASDVSFDAECELRVGKMGAAEIEAGNHTAREQRIKYFLSVLQQAVINHDYGQGKEKVPGIMKLMNRAKAISWMRETACNAEGAIHAMGDIFEECAKNYIYVDVGAENMEWGSGFAIETQIRIAGDMWRHLLTPPARPNLEFLWNHAYCFFQSRLQLRREQGNQPAPFIQIERHLARLQQCNKEEGKRILAEMAQTLMYRPHVEEDGYRMLLKVFAEISHEMVGTLLRLPYFDMLKEARHD